MLTKTLCLSFALAAAPSPADRSRDDVVEIFTPVELANGVRLSVATVPDAIRQTLFAVLPVGLASDDAGRTQYSHLLEHMLIRSTDPDGLAADGIVFNGETGDSLLRLDLHFAPKDAARAAARLAGWLTARACDPAVLDREKGNIAAEVANTAPRGFGHKWATAAWNQVVRHGAKQASVLADVQAATPESVIACIEANVAIGPRLRLYAVGPMAAEEVAAALDTAFGPGAGDGASGSRPVAAARPPARLAPLATGELEAAWDQPVGHYLEWYLLPEGKTKDAATAFLIGHLLFMRLQQDPGLQAKGVNATASADVVLPEGRLLMLSANLPDGVTADEVRKVLRGALDHLFDALPGIGPVDRWLEMAQQEFAGPPDFAAARRMMQGRPNADLVEAQMLLAAAMREVSANATFAQFGAAVRGLSVAEMKALASKHLEPARSSKLVLTPQ